MNTADLLDRARTLADAGARRILGITGPPDAGKTTLARAVVAELGPQRAALLPMDGFHLANATLVAWQRRDRKGAWDTFDAAGFVHLLRRLRAADEQVVHAPDFDRDLDESIGAAIPIPRDVPLIVAEGNYLLCERGDWAPVAGLLDEAWYVDLDDPTRHERLARRHETHGMTAEAAQSWARGTDQANALVVAAGRSRAQLVVTSS